MVSSNQFPVFRKKMGWPDSATFEPLLPITRKISRVKVEPWLSTSSSTPKRAATVIAACSQPLFPGYKIPRLYPASLATDASSQPPEPPASPPALLSASEVFLSEGEGFGGRRWQMAPQIEVVEADARTTIEKLLECCQPSKSIPGLRSKTRCYPGDGR